MKDKPTSDDVINFLAGNSRGAVKDATIREHIRRVFNSHEALLEAIRILGKHTNVSITDKELAKVNRAVVQAEGKD